MDCGSSSTQSHKLGGNVQNTIVFSEPNEKPLELLPLTMHLKAGTFNTSVKLKCLGNFLYFSLYFTQCLRNLTFILKQILRTSSENQCYLFSTFKYSFVFWLHKKNFYLFHLQEQQSIGSYSITNINKFEALSVCTTLRRFATILLINSKRPYLIDYKEFSIYSIKISNIFDIKLDDMICSLKITRCKKESTTRDKKRKQPMYSVPVRLHELKSCLRRAKEVRFNVPSRLEVTKKVITNMLQYVLSQDGVWLRKKWKLTVVSHKYGGSFPL